MPEAGPEETSKALDDWRALALQAGLKIALSDFPDDVLAAAQAAAQVRSAVVVTPGETTEPWPPMRLWLKRAG